MATIRKHPVPADSYDPNRPLNDLLIAQLELFKHIAKNLPADRRAMIPAEPAVEDRGGVERFVASVTDVHVSRKKARPQLVAKPVRRKRPATVDLAAATETPKKSKPAKNKRAKDKPAKKKSAKASAQGKAKSKSKRRSGRGSKP